MNIENKCEDDSSVAYDFSSALSQGKIRTEEDVKQDYKKIKSNSFYQHLNPFNYFKKEKPLFWNMHL